VGVDNKKSLQNIQGIGFKISNNLMLTGLIPHAVCSTVIFDSNNCRDFPVNSMKLTIQ
jgi:hypothetical protein